MSIYKKPNHMFDQNGLRNKKVKDERCTYHLHFCKPGKMHIPKDLVSQYQKENILLNPLEPNLVSLRAEKH